MTDELKLKTLKDFDTEKYVGEFCFKANSLKEDLRAEAIKRAKSFCGKHWYCYVCDYKVENHNEIQKY